MEAGVNVPNWVSQVMLMIIGVVAWWGIRRLVTGQDTINNTLHEISEKIGHLDGRLGRAETKLEMHEKSDDDRIGLLEKQTDSLWSVVRTLHHP